MSHPPFWAFAWPGGQALARHVLDHPAAVAGRRVLDFAAGCGIAAIACAHGGGRSVEAAEIDPLAVAAIRLNAAANGVSVDIAQCDIVGAACRWDLILCGDVCYEAPMTEHILPWLRDMACAGRGLAGRSRPRLSAARGSRAIRQLPRADKPGTGGSHRAGGDALPLARLTRRRIRLLRPGLAAAEGRQVDTIHAHRRPVAHDVPCQPIAIRLCQAAQHHQDRQRLLQVGVLPRLRRQFIEPGRGEPCFALPGVWRECDDLADTLDLCRADIEGQGLNGEIDPTCAKIAAMSGPSVSSPAPSSVASSASFDRSSVRMPEMLGRTSRWCGR